jgi:N-acetylglucosaminyldiphosphoundecaprenol N-acetyl-beta-D-mannosaminyltransferase
MSDNLSSPGLGSYAETCILGVKVHSISLENLLDRIARGCVENRKLVVANINVHAVNLAYRQPWFRDFLNHCDVVFCDGFGIKWAARFLAGTQLYRYTPPDWFPELARMCARENLTMYFLGARPGVAERAAVNLSAQAPGLRVVGMHDGFFARTPGSTEQQKVIEEINQIRPNLLVVGFGMPAQEAWIQEHLDELNINVALPVGAFFDYAAGEVTRAPRWMTDHGLEWLGRLLIEPGRLWRRYVLGNPLFLWRVLLQKLGMLRFDD